MPIPVQHNRVIPDDALSVQAVRASGPGGQSVNKTSSAVRLRLDLDALGWPEGAIARILRFNDGRISQRQRAITIACDTHRSFHRNQAEATTRLVALLRQALYRQPRRVIPPMSANQKRKRVEAKRRRSAVKSTRGPVKHW